MFKFSPEYQQIKIELELNKTISETAKFHSFADGVFTYVYDNDAFQQEFSFICDRVENILFYKMNVGELLDLKGIKFFKHSVVDPVTNQKIGALAYLDAASN